MKKNVVNKIIIATSIMALITLFLSYVIISYYSNERILYFDVLAIDIIAIFFSLFLIYDGFKEIDKSYKRFVGCLIKTAGGTAIFVIHVLEIIFIKILR